MNGANAGIDKNLYFLNEDAVFKEIDELDVAMFQSVTESLLYKSNARAKEHFRVGLSRGYGNNGNIVGIGLRDHERTQALLVISRAEWDSNFFGREVYNGYIFVDANSDVQLERFFQYSIAEFRKTVKVDLLSVSVNATFFATNAALERNGFYIRDLKSTYMISRGRAQRQDISNVGNNRSVVSDDIEAISEILREVRFPSRFVREPVVDQGRVQEMYIKWVERILQRPESDRAVRVIYRGSKPVSVTAMERVSRFEEVSGHRLFGNTIAASVPGHSGASWYCTADTTADALQKADFCECTLSVNNAHAIRVVEDLGYRYQGSMNAFHLT
jgi:hypothetical protein